MPVSRESIILVSGLDKDGIAALITLIFISYPQLFLFLTLMRVLLI